MLEYTNQLQEDLRKVRAELDGWDEEPISEVDSFYKPPTRITNREEDEEDLDDEELDFEAQNGITRLDWPSCCPDLNPMETVWQKMKDKLDALPLRPATIADTIGIHLTLNQIHFHILCLCLHVLRLLLLLKVDIQSINFVSTVLDISIFLFSIFYHYFETCASQT